MSLKSNKLQTNVVLNANKIEPKTNNAISLEKETLSIIGTASKGPAFVPKYITGFDNEDDSVLNSFESLYGNIEDNNYLKPIQTMNCGVKSFGSLSANFWFENGGEQISYTRVLGIGNGTFKETDTDILDKSGFYANTSQTSNSFGKMSINYGVSLVLNKLDNSKVDDYTYANSNFIEELGLAATNNNLFITDFIINANGVLPTLELKNEITNYHINTYNAVDQQYMLRKITSTAFKNNNEEIAEVATAGDFSQVSGPFGFFASHYDEIENKNFLYLNGFNNTNAAHPNILKLRDINYIESPRPYTEIDSFNYFYDCFKEKGHVVYASFPVCNLLKHKERTQSSGSYDNELLDQNIFSVSNLSSASIADFNNFESQYRKAKSPWIVSQSISIRDDTERTDISSNCKRLFRFYSLNDGESGNNVRIKILPKKLGSILDDIYSIFDLYVFEYDLENNSFDLVESYVDIDLNVNSSRYIERVIGTESEYYDFKNDLIVKEGFYLQQSKYIRVEVANEIKDQIYPVNYIPSGFEAYPHLNIRQKHFENYKNANIANLTGGDYNDLFSGVYQMPVSYSPNYMTDRSIVDEEGVSLCNNIFNSWGVLFQNIKLEKKLYKNKIDENEISPHYFYTKYFQSNLSSSVKNALKEDSNYLNGFFHLEKILIKKNSDNIVKSWVDAFYKPSGRNATSAYNLSSSGYKYLNINNDLTSNFENLNISFDIFLSGGYDGLNLLDVDDKLMNNKSLKDETSNESNDKITYTAYKKAIDIVFKNAEDACDIITIPGIKDLSLSNNVIDFCEDNNTIFIGDIDSSTTGQLKVLECSYSFDNNLRELGSSRRERTQFVRHNQTYDDSYNSGFDSDNNDFKGMGILSRFYYPVYGDQFDDQLEYPASTITAGIFAKSNFGPLNSSESYLDNGFSLLNRIGIHQEGWEDLSLELLSSGLNLFCYNFLDSANRIHLSNSNSTYTDRSSLFRKIYNTRIMNHIKKRVKFDLFTNENFVNGGVLFALNKSTEYIGLKVNAQLNVLLNEFTERGMINNFSVNIDNQSLQKNLEDLKNLKLNGNIIIQFKNEDNNRLIDISLNNIINQYSLLADNIVDSEIIIPKI